jgi:hypothetical protein
MNGEKSKSTLSPFNDTSDRSSSLIRIDFDFESPATRALPMICRPRLNFESDEWHVAHATNLEEEGKLIEAGFEFVRYS